MSAPADEPKPPGLAAALPRYCEPTEDQTEIPLTGGNTTDGVVRVGNTVRRPIGFNSRLVHGLLTHLESVGYTGAPRLLGIDAAGREVLTFIEGEVAAQPRPAWVADEGRLVSVARLVRACDDAAASYELPAAIKPFGGGAEAPGIPPGPDFPLETVGHMDVSPDNVVFRGGQAVALIDFDLARPVARVDEVHNIMLHWAPLADPADAEPPLRDLDVGRRCRIIADAYELDELDRSRLVDLAILRARRSWFSMRHTAEQRGGGWAQMWQDGIGDRIVRRQAWLEANAAALKDAITS